MNQLEEIFIEPGRKMNLHKWHKIMKRKIEDDGLGDLKGMGYHSLLACIKGDRKKGYRINASATRGMWHFVEGLGRWLCPSRDSLSLNMITTYIVGLF